VGDKVSRAQSATNTKVDAALVKQLKTASGSEELVEAVVRLRPDNPSEIVPGPERSETITKDLLARVKKQSGTSASRYNVFKNLGSFVVSAPPAFVKELMAQPEVAAILANQQPGSALIPPVKKAPVRDLPPRKGGTVKSKRAPTASKKVAGKASK
jgi:hypothetical protein